MNPIDINKLCDRLIVREDLIDISPLDILRVVLAILDDASERRMMR